MPLFSPFKRMLADLEQAQTMAQLFSMSDAELAARGLTRETLRQQAVAALGRR
ncbi:MAG: hypothetical protein AAGA87_12665 [Pseudomonadota bacterium]